MVSLTFYSINTLRALLLFVLLFFILQVGCQVQSFYHEPDIAATSAIYFAETAFIKREMKESYHLLSDDARKYITFQKYQTIVYELHPNGYPSTLKKLEYEPVPGQKAMNIFLLGENEKEKFYYRLALQGTAKDGYRVCGLYRGSGPYPQSKLRQKF